MWEICDVDTRFLYAMKLVSPIDTRSIVHPNTIHSNTIHWKYPYYSSWHHSRTSMCLHFFHIRSTSTLEHTLIFLEMYDKNEHVFINLSYGGGYSLLYQCIYVRSWPIYQGVIYLAKKITRYGVFQNKGKCLYFITPFQ